MPIPKSDSTPDADGKAHASPLRDDALQPGGQMISGGGEGRPPLNFDDGAIYSGRAKARRSVGTTEAPGGDSGRLGSLTEQLAPPNGPSDRDSPNGRGVDYLRNGHGATTAAAFSARSRPGMGVSMPVHWEQLAELKSGAQWTVSTAREYLSFVKSDPWVGYWKKRQGLTRSIQTIAATASSPSR